MIAIPAIDLKDGKVVRLLHGDFNAEKVYFKDASEVAARFEADGAARIHIVDLDGALNGVPKNASMLEGVLRRVKTPVEIGGGIRDLKTVERYLGLGASWVILGTKACLDRGFLEEALHAFGQKVIVGIDARDGRVATDGWTKLTEIPALKLARQVEDSGCKTVIYTDIGTDGALKGPNLKETEAICRESKMDIIASGGVGGLKDLEALKSIKAKNLKGVIIGKALYEQRFTLKEAITTCLRSA